MTPWDPFADVALLRNRFERFFDDPGVRPGERWMPAVDVVREDDRLVLRADVPGIEPDEIKVEVEGGMLTVSGEHEETKEEKERSFVRRERRIGAFSRSLALPDGVAAESIQARTKDGVLEVTVPLPAEVGGKEKVIITPTAGT
jgi:HSP20 family protein